MRSFVLFVALLLQIFSAGAEKCSWDNCPAYTQDKNVLNVHLICHTHDDLGWIKTVDQYYWGAKQTLVPVGVQYILNTVLDELEKDPTRRFSWAETGYLWRWMRTHDERQVERVKKLIQNGQMEVIGGGWVQNDEAASHYIEIIDQMTLGLRELNRTFGVCGRPKVAWQIDPFGHSKEFANLASKFGFEGLYFARIHYLEKEKRLKEKSMEFVWDTSEELKTAILTGAFFEHYMPPPGFCFDSLCGDDPIMDNEQLEEYNVDQKVEAFVNQVKKQAAVQRHNHVMMLMGGDFQYTNANTWYTNLDKLIKYVTERANGTVKVFYSTPACYVKAVTGSGVHVDKKNDDFFPYASSEHSYWTGYFTSRPTFKRFIREANGYLQLLKKLDSLAFVGGGGTKTFYKLDHAAALTQHHDAVTGTATQNVTNDYSKQLAAGWTQGTESLNAMMQKLSQKNANSSAQLPLQKFCLLNETNCDISQKSPNFTVIVYNSYSQSVSRVVRIPLHHQKASIYDKNGSLIPSEVVKSFLTNQLPTEARAPYEIQFNATVPPLGFTTFFVNSDPKSVKEDSQKAEIAKRQKNATTRWRRNLQTNETVVSNGVIELTFDSNGFLKSYTDVASKSAHPLRQEFLWYRGMGQDKLQPTGAYIFRPNGSEPNPMGANVTLKVVKTGLSVEVRQIFNDWVSQVIRLEANSSVVQFQWTVGPIPKEKTNPIAKEVITRFSTEIASNGVFYTDSNGRQMMQRKRNYAPAYTYNNTEPVAANYFPLTSTIYLKDSKNQLTICTDRAQGGSSLKDGEIEIMVHRRAFVDDHWGVDEPLDELGRSGKGLVATGTHYLMLSGADETKLQQRVLAQEIFHEPLVTFAALNTTIADHVKNLNTEFSGLSTPLPPHINILTLELVKKGVVLLRLEHILQNSEDKLLAQPCNIDLKGLFSNFEILNLEELTLGANQRVDESDFHIGAPSRFSRLTDQGLFAPFRSLFTRIEALGNINVRLSPMDIKTFRLEVRPRQK